MARTYTNNNYREKYADIRLEGGSLILDTSYDAGLAAALKGAVPHTERKWEPNLKAWIVAPQHGKLLETLCAQYLGLQVSAPRAQTVAQEEIRILDIRYVGATKDRAGADERSAFGFSNGSWSVIFPESVLLLWFTGLVNRVEATTLYGVLGVKRAAAPDEIKSAFRRLARQWHPDVCREPDAQTMFIRIKEAYDLLNEPGKRARYDAGLALEATLKQEAKQSKDGYRPPLRCGYVQAAGVEQVGRFLVKQIFGWEEITDGYGRTLVTSWPYGADKFVERWV